ncbi:MAG: hypothetical protein AAGD01_08505 [Acidobacteriota bacterium]
MRVYPTPRRGLAMDVRRSAPFDQPHPFDDGENLLQRHRVALGPRHRSRFAIELGRGPTAKRATHRWSSTARRIKNLSTSGEVTASRPQRSHWEEAAQGVVRKGAPEGQTTGGNQFENHQHRAEGRVGSRRFDAEEQSVEAVQKFDGRWIHVLEVIAGTHLGHQRCSNLWVGHPPPIQLIRSLHDLRIAQITPFDVDSLTVSGALQRHDGPATAHLELRIEHLRARPLVAAGNGRRHSPCGQQEIRPRLNLVPRLPPPETTSLGRQRPQSLLDQSMQATQQLKTIQGHGPNLQR